MLWRPSPAAIIVTFVTKFQLASGIWCPVRIIWKKVIKIFFPKNQIILLYQKDHNKGLVGDSSYCLVTPMPLCSKAPMVAKTSFSSTLTTFSYFVWRVGRKINARFVSIGQKWMLNGRALEFLLLNQYAAHTWCAENIQETLNSVNIEDSLSNLIYFLKYIFAQTVFLINIILPPFQNDWQVSAARSKAMMVAFY